MLRAGLVPLAAAGLAALLPATAWTLAGIVLSYVHNPQPLLPFAAWGAYRTL